MSHSSQCLEEEGGAWSCNRRCPERKAVLRAAKEDERQTLARSGDTILPCPFCGAPASIEEIASYSGVQFSVGCDSASEAECMGYQSFTTFNTRKEAVMAWNRRPVPSR